MFRAADILDELAQFFAQCCEDFVFVFDRLYIVY